MKVGFVGLGKMGGQMVTRLLQDHHEVVVSDLNPSAVEMVVKLGATSAKDRTDMIKQLEPVIIWLMIPAAMVDGEIDALLKELPEGSILIDGGNSDYRETIKRAGRCAEHRVRFMDVGTSGGVLGLKEGFSMMIGGEEEAFKTIEPLIKSLARANGYQHFGPNGAGHFIKMVHNGIEYGMMEAYAEGYHLLKENSQFPGLDLSAVAGVWQNGSIVSSQLNEIIRQILNSSPDLAGVEGYVAESGEGRWTLETAQAMGVEAPAIRAAMDVRVASQQGKTTFATKLLAAMRNVFGGHTINK